MQEEWRGVEIRCRENIKEPMRVCHVILFILDVKYCDICHCFLCLCGYFMCIGMTKYDSR